MEINIEIHGLPNIGWSLPKEIEDKLIKEIRTTSIGLLGKIRVTTVQDRYVDSNLVEMPFLRIITEKPEKSETVQEEAEFTNIIAAVRMVCNMTVEIQHISLIIRRRFE